MGQGNVLNGILKYNILLLLKVTVSKAMYVYQRISQDAS